MKRGVVLSLWAACSLMLPASLPAQLAVRPRTVQAIVTRVDTTITTRVDTIPVVVLDTIRPLFYDNHAVFPAPVAGRYVKMCLMDSRGCNVQVTPANSLYVRLRPDLPDPYSGTPSLEQIFHASGRYSWGTHAWIDRTFSARAYSWVYRARVRYNKWTTNGADTTCTATPACAFKQWISGMMLEPNSRIGFEWTNFSSLQSEWYQGTSGATSNYQYKNWTYFWYRLNSATPPPFWSNGRWQDVVVGFLRTSDSTGIQFTYWTDADSLQRKLLTPQLRNRMDVRVPGGSGQSRLRVVGTDTVFRSITSTSAIGTHNYNRKILPSHEGMSIIWGTEEVYDLERVSQPWLDYPDFYLTLNASPYAPQTSQALPALSRQGPQDLARWDRAWSQAHQTPARFVRSARKRSQAHSS